MNLAFRYPQWFGKVVAFSGRYDLTCGSGPFRSLFDGYYDQNVYFNTPSHFIPNLADERILRLLRRMEVTLVIGSQDPFLENNQELSSALWSRGVWNSLELWDGEAHRPRYWRQMVTRYI